MSVTSPPRNKQDCNLGDTMPRKKTTGPETKPVRVHLDVAEMAETLAPIFDMTTPDFVSGILRQALEKKQKEAVERLRAKRMQPQPPESDPK